MKARSRSRRVPAPAEPVPIDPSPGRYIARVSRLTGEEIAGPDRSRGAAGPRAPRQPPGGGRGAVPGQPRHRRSPATRRAWATGCARLNRLGAHLARHGRLAHRQQGVRARGLKQADGRRGPRRRLPLPRAHAPVGEGGARPRREAAEGRARRRCGARGRNPRLRVLLTGATGFLGKEILAQAATTAASRSSSRWCGRRRSATRRRRKS